MASTVMPRFQGSRPPHLRSLVLALVQEGCALISAGLQHRSSASRVGFVINAADLEALAPAEAALLAAASGQVDAGEPHPPPHRGTCL